MPIGWYANVNKHYPDVQDPACIMERCSESIICPLDFLHYRDGESHKTHSHRNITTLGPEWLQISEEDARKVLKFWKDVWFDRNKELYEKRDAALIKGDVTYYSHSRSAPFNKMKPEGLLRKVQISPTHSLHEKLKRGTNIWYPTEFFRLYDLGHNEDNYEELTAAELEKVLTTYAN